MASGQIKLQSSDGEVFDVDIKVAQCSLTIKQMLEDLGVEDNDEEVVPLPNVTAAILRKVISWAQHHKVIITIQVHMDIKRARMYWSKCNDALIDL